MDNARISGHSKIITGELVDVLSKHSGFPDLSAIALASSAYGFVLVERERIDPQVCESVAGYLRAAAEMLDEQHKARR